MLREIEITIVGSKKIVDGEGRYISGYPVHSSINLYNGFVDEETFLFLLKGIIKDMHGFDYCNTFIELVMCTDGNKTIEGACLNKEISGNYTMLKHHSEVGHYDFHIHSTPMTDDEVLAWTIQFIQSMLRKYKTEIVKHTSI